MPAVAYYVIVLVHRCLTGCKAARATLLSRLVQAQHERLEAALEKRCVEHTAHRPYAPHKRNHVPHLWRGESRQQGELKRTKED